ncbi:cell wall metabolism sensor histidine kinase WalK [Anaeromyxobacter sp. SG64]|uniref:sensor histidine kinase n=1 Tax=Anaeromyxobacter sp. SG64 TaxID=2925409 RepID=UPI001F59755B|nr:ATP-binding protein [Anaeromyxobacter sp. SG64]
MLGRTPLNAAIRALRAELAGGPPADLGRDVRELAELLAARAPRRGGALHPDATEQELLAALPDAAALVSRDGWVRVSNAAFDTLAASGRAAGLTPLEITRSAELSEAVKRALEGTARKLELQLGRRTWLVHLAPLLRGEVLLLLRDVTEAKRAAATRRDFVANASHELRTPVAAIRAAAETLLAGALEDPAAAREFVGIVARHAERLSRLTQDLLDLSRIESRQWSFELAPVDAAHVTAQAVDLVAAAARGKGLRLAAEVPDEARVRADARALEQVLVNLVENAVKYTAEGGVTVGAEREGDGWVLSVTDTGPGIDRHHLPRLFERFYRIDPGRARDHGGTGLGLAIVKHLVQGMGGEVGVESGASGSRFWVRLPAA